MTRGLRHPDMAPALILLAISMVTLATVYASQYIGGLQPCPLCLYQRWPWWGALALSGLALLPVLSVNLRTVLLFAAGLGLLAGAGVAMYHVGVEQHGWPGPASCGSTGPIPTSFAQMQQLMQRPAASCDEPAWTLFGVSMAGYNAMLSIVVSAWVLVTAAAVLLSKGSLHPR
jgi:disulfide bond formation protein DsbB